MKPFLFTLLFGAALSAQTSSFSPAGPWAFCESPVGPSFAFCAGFIPGNEGYLLLIQAGEAQSSIMAYRYIVTGTLIATGESVTRTGIVERIDRAGGNASTPVILYFGGAVRDISKTVEGLSVIVGAAPCSGSCTAVSLAYTANAFQLSNHKMWVDPNGNAQFGYAFASTYFSAPDLYAAGPAGTHLASPYRAGPRSPARERFSPPTDSAGRASLCRRSLSGSSRPADRRKNES